MADSRGCPVQRYIAKRGLKVLPANPKAVAEYCRNMGEMQEQLKADARTQARLRERVRRIVLF